jgi:hypothetical protein
MIGEVLLDIKCIFEAHFRFCCEFFQGLQNENYANIIENLSKILGMSTKGLTKMIDFFGYLKIQNIEQSELYESLINHIRYSQNYRMEFLLSL